MDISIHVPAFVLRVCIRHIADCHRHVVGYMHSLALSIKKCEEDPDGG